MKSAKPNSPVNLPEINPKQTHKLSEQEESEIRECFALFDRDKDGKIKVCCVLGCC